MASPAPLAAAGAIIAARSPREMAALAAYEASQRRLGGAGGGLLDRRALAGHVGSPLYVGGWRDAQSGTLEPLAYALGLAAAAEAAGARLFERSPATARAETARGVTITAGPARIEADALILASNADSMGLAPELARHVLPWRSFIAATEALPGPLARALMPGRAAVHDMRRMLDYYRLDADGRLIFGIGLRNRPGPAGAREVAALRCRLGHVFPDLAGAPLSGFWSGTLAVTRSGLPHIGRRGRHMLFAQGYGGHGLALSAAIGELLAATAARAESAAPPADFTRLAALAPRPFPGGPAARRPLRALAGRWQELRDRL